MIHLLICIFRLFVYDPMFCWSSASKQNMDTIRLEFTLLSAKLKVSRFPQGKIFCCFYVICVNTEWDCKNYTSGKIKNFIPLRVPYFELKNRQKILRYWFETTFFFFQEKHVATEKTINFPNIMTFKKYVVVAIFSDYLQGDVHFSRVNAKVKVTSS